MLLVLFYQCFAGFLAWWNYILIKNNQFKNYLHTANGILHICASLTIGYYSEWNYGISSLLFTRVVFDTVLNILRHKGLGYVSPAPASKIDQIEKKIVFWIAAKVHKKRALIAEEDIERVAICFRIFILGLATTFLFL